jgi:hypothetical protein
MTSLGAVVASFDMIRRRACDDDHRARSFAEAGMIADK